MTKHIIITGANGNMGAAAVRKFLSQDYYVIAVDHSGSHLGFAEGLSNFELHEVDLDNEEATQLFFQEIISLKGKIDAALLLVGGFTTGNIETTDIGTVKKMFTLNFETVYNAARPLFLHMKNNNYGRLVFVGAKPALDANTGKDVIAYALSKSLLFKLAEFLNAEASGKNIEVTVIAPGNLDTAINRKNMPGVDTSTWIKPEEVADLFFNVIRSKVKVI